MPSTVPGTKGCPLLKSGNDGSPTLLSFQSSAILHVPSEATTSVGEPHQKGSCDCPMDKREGPGQRIFLPTWLQARENPLFLDSVYGDKRTITGTCRKEQTFLSHPKRSNSSKREMSASLTNAFLKSLINFGPL